MELNDSSKIWGLNATSWQKINSGDYSEALTYSKAALLLAESRNHKNGIIKSCNTIGWVYTNMGNYKSALMYQERGLKDSRTINNKTIFAAFYNSISVIYNYMGVYHKALNFQLLAINVKKDIGLERKMAGDYNNLGMIYFSLTNYKDAITNYLKALQINNAYLNKTSKEYVKNVGIFNINLGNVYYSTKNYDSALLAYSVSLKIANDIVDKKMIATSYGNIGLIYSDKIKTDENPCRNKDYFNKSLSNYLLALKYFEDVGDKMGAASFLNTIGELHFKNNNYKQSLSYFERALSLFKSNDFSELKRVSCEYLFKIHEKQKNYKESLKYHKLFMGIQDSLFSSESSKQIIEMTTKYETSILKEKNTLLNKENLINKIKFNADLDKEKLLSRFFITLTFFALLVIASLLGWYKQKMANNKILSIKNEESIRHNALLEGQKKERLRIARDLHDGVGGSLTGIRLRLMSLDKAKVTTTELNKIIDNITLVCKEVRIISHDLSLPFLLKNTSLTEIIDTIVQNFSQQKHTRIRCFYSNKEELNGIENDLKQFFYFVLQELLSNALKYSNATEIEINFSIDDLFTYFLIEDNGVGCSEKIYNNGTGIKGIFSRVKEKNGKLHIDSEMGRGTTVSIEIPINKLK